MEKLVVKEVLHPDSIPVVAQLLERPRWISSQVVTARNYSIRYDDASEIRFGPALYRATIDGPRNRELSSLLEKRSFFAPKSPHQMELGWYVFVEWCGYSNGKGSSAITILDLELGKVIATHNMDSAAFVGWSGGASGECIVQEHETNRSSLWYARDARTGRKRLLFRGGYEGHISADGRYLLVLHTRAEVFVALISIASASVLDLTKAADFQSYVQNVTGLDTVSFDAHVPRLDSMLNWAGTDYQTGRITFEKLITIEVCNKEAWC